MISIGTSFAGGGEGYLERILPLVDVVEVTPDSLASIRNGRGHLRDDVLDVLQEIARRARLVVHGVGLSIGSHSGYNEDYLRLIEPLFDRLDVAWHSEHLGYTRVDGHDLGTMLVLPRLEEIVDMICARVEDIQRRYRVPFLLENVVNLLPEHSLADFTPAGFLNAITRRTGCGLILDVYNLECDADNHRLDVEAFLDELDFGAVREIHLANGVVERGLRLDVHSRRTRPETLDLADRVLARATAAELVVYELLPQAIESMGDDGIECELTLLRERFAA
jgi:uncharacterized protein (UPF0276 family)